jgi:hypothetical protein
MYDIVEKYSYGKYFVNQEPKVLDDITITKLKGKPFFGGKYHVGDIIFYLIIEKHEYIETNIMDNVTLNIVCITHRNFKELEDDYEFSRHAGKLPIFKRKDSTWK